MGCPQGFLEDTPTMQFSESSGVKEQKGTTSFEHLLYKVLHYDDTDVHSILIIIQHVVFFILQNLDPNLTPCTEINSKQVTDLNAKT